MVRTGMVVVVVGFGGDGGGAFVLHSSVYIYVRTLSRTM